MNTLSKACQTVPPVVTSGYEPKGTYTQVGLLKTYVTGNPSASRGVIDVYDVLGLTDQTIQGADRLAEMLDAAVLMPDFFENDPIDASVLAMDTEEKKAKAKKWLAGTADISKNVSLLQGFVPAARSKFPSVKAWGVFGLCWGGKVAVQCCGEGTPFAVSGQAHPGQLAKEDAERMVIPHVCLASNGEPADVVQVYKDVLGSQGEVETYGTMHHGWMGGRANLKNEENAKEFERGYNQVAQFFAQHL